MKKRKVFIDIRPLIPANPSGVAHYISNVLLGLDRILDDPSTPKDIDYQLIVPFRARKLIENRLTLRNLNLRSIYLPFRLMNLLVRKNLLPPLDLFYGKGLYLFPGFAKAPLLRSKSAVIIYDVVHKKMPESVAPKMKTLLDSKVPEALRSDLVITISEQTKKDLLALDSRANICIVHPSVDLTLFYPRSRNEIIQTKNNFDISGGYILAVGNLEPRKNYPTLLKAYAQLPQEIRDRYALVIIGADSWNSEEITDAIKEYWKQGYRIALLVNRVGDPQMPAFYSGASAFVFPSLYEGFGIPPVEAMACGTPVIASNNSAIHEAIGDAAITLKKTTDAKELSEKLTRILTDQKQRELYRQKGFARVDAWPSWDDAARTLHDALRRILGDKS